jgi:hypothetical protein
MENKKMHQHNQSAKEVALEVLSAHEKIMNGLTEDGYFIFKHEDIKRLVELARDEYVTLQPSLHLNPQKSKLDRLNLAKMPWRKLAIGATNGVGEPYAQFLTTTYFAECDKKYPALTQLFDLLIRLRNNLCGLLDDFKPEKFWNACRLHHYPRGGAFMSRHRDTHFPKLLASSAIPFLQVSACMSKKGEDFSEGGGFLISKKGEKVDLESFGSLVFFDGAIEHGVDCIDLDVIPELSASSGRIAAFVNFYEILN